MCNPMQPHLHLKCRCSLCETTQCAAATQIAKMTPFSFCVAVVTSMTLTIMALLQLQGGHITYVIVSLTFYRGCSAF